MRQKEKQLQHQIIQQSIEIERMILILQVRLSKKPNFGLTREERIDQLLGLAEINLFLFNQQQRIQEIINQLLK